MAKTTQNSDQYANAHVSEPRVQNHASEVGGGLRTAHFKHNQSGAGDAGSSVALVKLPPGRVRVYFDLSNAYVNWTTGSATLDLGWDAYTDLNGQAVAADPNGLLDGLDVDTAGKFSLAGSLTAAEGYTKEFLSKDGVTLRATSQDVAIADDDDMVGQFVFAVG